MRLKAIWMAPNDPEHHLSISHHFSPATHPVLWDSGVTMRVVISSAGRRVYLVEWFQHALRDAGLDGDVYVLDYDPGAATAAAADGYRKMPAFTDEHYSAALLGVLDELKPDLMISLNDYELTALSQGLSDEIRANGTVVPSLSAISHQNVADKLSMYRALQAAGIPTPHTVSLSDAVGIYELLENSNAVIIKERWGSGSSGLQRLSRQQAHQWLNSHATVMIDEDPQRLDALIMQPDLGGTEYGLDVIAPVHGGPVEGVLGRRKLSMRHGETSAAMTVDAQPFHGLAAALNATLNIQGTVDVDVMVTDEDVPHVIDINPRFGGGYPFSHIAGADVPHFLIASTLGLTPRTGWNAYRHDFVGAKHEGIIGFKTADRPSTVGSSRDDLALRQVS